MWIERCGASVPSATREGDVLQAVQRRSHAHGGPGRRNQPSDMPCPTLDEHRSGTTTRRYSPSKSPPFATSARDCVSIGHQDRTLGLLEVPSVQEVRSIFIFQRWTQPVRTLRYPIGVNAGGWRCKPRDGVGHTASVTQGPAYASRFTCRCPQGLQRRFTIYLNITRPIGRSRLDRSGRAQQSPPLGRRPGGVAGYSWISGSLTLQRYVCRRTERSRDRLAASLWAW